MMSQAIREKKDREDAQETLLSQKHVKRYNDQKRREHEDHLKHFQVGDRPVARPPPVAIW
jgi:hypothetical protein